MCHPHPCLCRRQSASNALQCRSITSQVAEITKEGWLHLKHTPHLLWELPEVLSSEEAHSNLLAVSRLLQSHGAPHSTLSHAAAYCPELFRLQAGYHAQGIPETVGFLKWCTRFRRQKRDASTVATVLCMQQRHWYATR